MYASRAKNVCKLQNTMKPFFLYSQLINTVFLLVPPVVLVIMDNLFNFQDFLSFLKCIYTPLKKVTKVTKWDICKSPNKSLIVFFLFIKLTLIFV